MPVGSERESERRKNKTKKNRLSLDCEWDEEKRKEVAWRLTTRRPAFCARNTTDCWLNPPACCCCCVLCVVSRFFFLLFLFPVTRDRENFLLSSISRQKQKARRQASCVTHRLIDYDQYDTSAEIRWSCGHRYGCRWRIGSSVCITTGGQGSSCCRWVVVDTCFVIITSYITSDTYSILQSTTWDPLEVVRVTTAKQLMSLSRRSYHEVGKRCLTTTLWRTVRRLLQRQFKPLAASISSSTMLESWGTNRWQRSRNRIGIWFTGSIWRLHSPSRKPHGRTLGNKIMVVWLLQHQLLEFMAILVKSITVQVNERLLNDTLCTRYTCWPQTAFPFIHSANGEKCIQVYSLSIPVTHVSFL